MVTNSLNSKYDIHVTGSERSLNKLFIFHLFCLLLLNLIKCYTKMQISHSAYPDSPLGPDAFHEYESLLVQDYEELVKKAETKSTQPEDKSLQDNLPFEDEGWSRLTSSEEGFPRIEASSSGRDIYNNNLIGHAEDVGQKLVVSVHHFPMLLCPFSPRVFVLPSEGSIAEAYVSAEHEDSLSPGLPPLSTGLPSDGDDVPPGATLTAHFLYHLAAKVISCVCAITDNLLYVAFYCYAEL